MHMLSSLAVGKVTLCCAIDAYLQCTSNCNPPDLRCCRRVVLRVHARGYQRQHAGGFSYPLRPLCSFLLAICQASHDWSEGVHTRLKHDDIRQPVLLAACVQHFTELCDRTEQDEWALKHLRWGKPPALSELGGRSVRVVGDDDPLYQRTQLQ